MELLFIYNADSGAINKLIDFTHKIVSPSTYNCQLCSITYGNFGMRKEWQQFLNDLNMKINFSYKNKLTWLKDDFIETPCIYLKNNDNQSIQLVSANEINQCSNVDALKALIKNKLVQHYKK